MAAGLVEGDDARSVTAADTDEDPLAVNKRRSRVAMPAGPQSAAFLAFELRVEVLDKIDVPERLAAGRVQTEESAATGLRVDPRLVGNGRSPRTLAVAVGNRGADRFVPKLLAVGQVVGNDGFCPSRLSRQNTRPLLTTGEPMPAPNGALQRSFGLSGKEVGTASPAGTTPVLSGPRHRGQSAAETSAGPSELQPRTNSAISDGP